MWVHMQKFAALGGVYAVPANSTRAGAVPRTPGGARHGDGNRAVTSQLRAIAKPYWFPPAGLPKSQGGNLALPAPFLALFFFGNDTANVSTFRKSSPKMFFGTVRGGGGATGVGAQKAHTGAPTDRGRSNTDTQNAGATPRGTGASTAGKEEGRSKAGEATRTGNQNGGHGRVWEAATTKGMAWPASPVATGCQGNPC